MCPRTGYFFAENDWATGGKGNSVWECVTLGEKKEVQFFFRETGFVRMCNFSWGWCVFLFVVIERSNIPSAMQRERNGAQANPIVSH